MLIKEGPDIINQTKRTEFNELPAIKVGSFDFNGIIPYLYICWKYSYNKIANETSGANGPQY